LLSRYLEVVLIALMVAVAIAGVILFVAGRWQELRNRRRPGPA
jgi:hypothetical protein